MVSSGIGIYLRHRYLFKGRLSRCLLAAAYKAERPGPWPRTIALLGRPQVTPREPKVWPVRDALLATWLKLSGLQPGLPINFNVVLIKYGVRRRVNRS
jgi:hypothetical protein